MTSSDATFSPLRSWLWPIHSHELRKILPMMLMLFLICFNYSILRNLKDTVVVTAGTSSGAEVIPFIKVWAMLPMAVILTIIFTKLSNRFSQERVFYYMITGFLVFYALFGFVLYPLRDYLHPNATADSLALMLPPGFKGLVAMVRNWTFTGFYVMSELWSTMVMSVLFFGFANEITRVSEARRFYGVLGIGSNLAAIVAGQSGVYFSTIAYNPSLPYGNDGWEQAMISLVIVVILSGIAIMAIFRWMNKNVLNDPCFADLHNTAKAFKIKQKLSFRESFSYLSQSKYLICIAFIVIAYNLVINLVEVLWKDQLRLAYPNPSDYNRYLNYVTTVIGIVAMVTSFFTAKMISKFGWTKTALITPITLLLTSVGFFSFLFFGEPLSNTVMALIGTTPLAIAVFFGAAQNCLCKAAKYSVFDSTKEIAFIPLSHECKLKGKAAIDGVGSRLGKSGGSLIHQGLLMFFFTLSASAPIVAAILTFVIVGWIVATKMLGTQFNALVATRELEALAAGNAVNKPSASSATVVTA